MINDTRLRRRRTFQALYSMYYTDMGRKRKFTLWAFAVLGVLIVLMVGAGIYLQTVGYPEFLRRRLLAATVPQGVRLEIGGMRGGLFGDLVVEDLRLYDGKLTDTLLVSVPQLTVSLDREVLWKLGGEPAEIRWRGGTVRLPLAAGDDADDLLLKQVSGRLRSAAGSWDVEGFSADLERLRWRLDVKLPAGEEDGEGLPPWLSEDGVLTVRPLFPRLVGPVRRGIDEILRLARVPADDARGQVAVTADWTGEPTAEITLHLPGGTYRDLQVRQLSARVRYQETELSIDEFRLGLDKQQYLHLDGSIDLEEWTVTAAMVSRCYPRPLVHGFRPGLLEQEWMPTFHGPPPYLEASVENADLRDPLHWHAAVDFDVRDATFRKGRLAAWRGHAELRLPDIHVTEVYGRIVEPGAEFTGELEWENDEEIFSIRGTALGDPRFVARLCRTDRTRNAYLRIWRDFAWPDGVWPRFELDVTMFVPRDADDTVRVSGHADWPGTRWQGILVDRASADVDWDSEANRLEVRNFKISRNGHDADAEFTVQWGEPAAIEFDLDSGLELSVLAGIIRPEWQGFLWEQQIVAAGERVQASGRYQWEPERTLDVDGRIDVTDLRYREFGVRDAGSTFAWHDGILTAAPSAGELRWQDWRLRRVHVAELSYKEPAVTLGKTSIGEVAGTRLDATDVVLDSLTRQDDGSVETVGRAAKVRLDNVRLSEPRIASFAWQPDGTVRATGRVADAAGQDWRAEKIDVTRFSRNAAGRTDFAAAAAAADYNDSSARQLSIDGTVEGEKVSGTVQASRFSWRRYSGEGLEITGETPDLGTTGNAEVSIDTLAGPDGYRFSGVDGQGRRQADGRVQFQGGIASVTDDDPDLQIDQLDIASGSLQGVDYELTWKARRVRFGDHLDLAGASGQVTGRDEETATCDLEVDNLTGKRGLVAEKVKGTVTRTGTRWRFDLAAPVLDHDVFTLDQPHFTGDYVNESAVFDLTAAGLDVEGFPFRDVRTRVHANARDLWVRDLAAGLFEGTAKGSFSYDFEQRTGKTRWEVADLDFPALLGALGAAGTKTDGVLDGQCQLTFSRGNGEDTPLQLRGAGSAHLRQAYLWQVPLVGEFFNLIGGVLTFGAFSQERIGRISEAQTDFLLQGDRAKIVNLRTNGDLIAISASGYYWWRTQGIDLRVRPIFFEMGLVNRLKNFVFDILPNPFAPLLHYRVVGTVQDHTWRPLEGIGDLLRDRPDPADPTLKRADDGEQQED